MPAQLVEASAPGRVDLAGGTLDLWPLHVLHPGSVTVNVAIDRYARSRVTAGVPDFRVVHPASGFELRAGKPAELLADPRAALVGALLEAMEVDEPLEIELRSEIPFGSGLGGSSALAVCLMGALEKWSRCDLAGGDRVAFVRDVETRVLVKPAGVQDYYPPLDGGAHVIAFPPGRIAAKRFSVNAEDWTRHLIVLDSGAAHSSGMNNWEIYRARMEGDAAVAGRLDDIRSAAVDMADALVKEDFAAMGKALCREWSARRRLAPVVSTPLIDRAIASAVEAGAWGGKACGAGGGGCVVFLSPADRRDAVAKELGNLGEGRVLEIRVVNEGLNAQVKGP
jgi:D-glycero-alpha-D-manno-heptose-7-phosphate kinase